MTLTPVSVTIITLNEESNLPRTLASLKWADEVIVVDSGSTDRTVEIAKQFGAKTLHNSWRGYGQQKNFAQNQATHNWVLNIDADEVVTPELAREVRQTIDKAIDQNPATHGYSMPRKTFYLGRWIKHGGWYPNYLMRLADKRFATWTEPSVHEELQVEGEVGRLAEPILHYAFSSIQDQILTNLRFSTLGSQDLKRIGQRPSLKKLIFKPIGKFFETYLLKGGFRDGLAGLIISVNAAHSMFLKYAYLLEARIAKPEESPEKLPKELSETAPAKEIN
jgi:glycosyltransferase involved in cell wall biosynthesis